MRNQVPQMTAVAAATRLGMSRERVVRLVQVGTLRGSRDPARGWLVEAASVDEFLATQAGTR